MTPAEIAEIRPRLVDFAGRMLAELPRVDQQSKGELYLRGLLSDGRRKSMQPMAQRLGVGTHQQLQQFVTSSTWDYERVRANVARWGGDYLKDRFDIDLQRQQVTCPSGTTVPIRPISGHARHAGKAEFSTAGRRAAATGAPVTASDIAAHLRPPAVR